MELFFKILFTNRKCSFIIVISHSRSLTMKTKKLLLPIIIIFGLFFTGCQSDTWNREHGKSYSAGEQEYLTTSFFKYAVLSAETADIVEGYKAKNEGETFLIVKTSIKSVFKKDIPMSIYDFELKWGKSDDDMTYAEENFADGQFSDNWTISPEETSDGNLIFVVPADEKNFSLVYQENWDDGFVGNTYSINFKVDAE